MSKSFSVFVLTAATISLSAPSFAQTTLLEIETGKRAVSAPAPIVTSPIKYDVYDKMISKIAVEQGGRPRLAYDFLRRQDTQFIDTYIGYLEGQTVQSLPKNDQLAYWLNLQNIVVIKAILDDSKKKKSLKKLRGTAETPGLLWTKPRVTVAGQALSLQDIEAKLLTEFDNPNVIYGLYQGVRGGPALSSTAYRGASVIEMLEKQAKRYVNGKGIVSVKRDVVEVTPVFLWYQDAAFDGDDVALNNHLKAHADPNLKSALFRGKGFKAKSLNYRIDNYVVPKQVNTSVLSNGSSGGSGGGSRGYGS